MPSDRKKEPQENFMDKIGSFFGGQAPQKAGSGLPPKAHFSIWYFLMVLLLFSYLQQYYLFKKSGDDFLQSI